MPPIFQPEAAAEAIVKAADTAPRELWVGNSSLLAIVGNLFFPATIDRVLAHRGFDGQQTAETAAPDRADNLFRPAPGPVAAHGRFDGRARARVVSVRQDTVEHLMVAGIASLLASTVVLGGRAAWRKLAAR